MDDFLGARRRIVAAVVVLSCSVLSSTAYAQRCGDADANGRVTVTDGVQILRAAARLQSGCDGSLCDVDGSGSVTVTDGVNVLRAAAELSAALNCGRDTIFNSVSAGGAFGSFTKVPGGLVEPPGAAETIQGVTFGNENALVPGRINNITVDYDIGAAAAGAEPADLSLIVSSSVNDGTATPTVFQVPITSPQDTLTIELNVRDDIAIQQFDVLIANGSGGRPIGRIRQVTIVVIQDLGPGCGNRVLDGNESCDPPGFKCAVLSNPGFCNTECSCEPFVVPTPSPGRFVDNGDGTVTDNQSGLQWEKKTSVVGSGANPADPHDVDNLYQWCSDANGDQVCDNPPGSPDGTLFGQFLATLNTAPCFAGHCDWRVARVNRDGDPSELGTIVDAGAPGCGAGGPCIDPIFGPTVALFYWSSTTNAALPFSARVVDFRQNGNVLNGGKFNFAYARAVRQAFPVPTPTPFPGRFVDNGDGTVTDNQSGLQWEKKTSVVGSGANPADPHDVDNLYQWCSDANGDQVCDNPPGSPDGTLFGQFLATLNTAPCFAGHCDWRVPRVNENGDPAQLETIVDKSAPGCGAGGPCIDPIFGPTVALFYWSATTSATLLDSAFVVDFQQNGNILNGRKYNFAYGRAVRDR